MFYILVSRIPFIYNINEKKDKLFKTFLIGSICYIILHGFLHSRKFSDNNLIEKYRKYLMHLAGIDFVLTSGIVFLLDNKLTSKIEVNSYIENADDNNDDDDEENDSIENDEKKMTRDEILNNYYKNQMLTNQQTIPTPLQQNSPFINKADAEELKKKDCKSEQENMEEKKVSEKQKSKSSKSSEEHNSKDDQKENIDELLDLITNTDIPVYKSATL